MSTLAQEAEIWPSWEKGMGQPPLCQSHTYCLHHPESLFDWRSYLIIDHLRFPSGTLSWPNFRYFCVFFSDVTRASWRQMWYPLPSSRSPGNWVYAPKSHSFRYTYTNTLIPLDSISIKSFIIARHNLKVCSREKSFRWKLAIKMWKIKYRKNNELKINKC